MSLVILPLMWNIYSGTCRIDCGLLQVFLLWCKYDSGGGGGSWGEGLSLWDFKSSSGVSDEVEVEWKVTAEPRRRFGLAHHHQKRCTKSPGSFLSFNVNIKVGCHVMTEFSVCFFFSLRTSSFPTSPSSPTAASLCRPAATSPSRRCNGPTPATTSARRWLWRAASWPRPNWRSQMVRLERLQQMHLFIHLISSGSYLPLFHSLSFSFLILCLSGNHAGFCEKHR